MADRVSVSITIGSPLSSDALGDFLDRVAAERLSPEWDGAPSEMADLIPGRPIARQGRAMGAALDALRAIRLYGTRRRARRQGGSRRRRTPS